MLIIEGGREDYILIHTHTYINNSIYRRGDTCGQFQCISDAVVFATNDPFN